MMIERVPEEATEAEDVQEDGTPESGAVDEQSERADK